MNIVFDSAPARCCGILALVPVVWLLTGCGEEVVEQASVVRPINILTVGGLTRGEALNYPGEIRPIQNADLAFEVPGRLIELPVLAGEDVQAGQQLARLDPADYQSTVSEAQAGYNAAESTYNRYLDLFETGAVSAQAFDVAQRNVEVAAAQLETATKGLSDTRLIAPFAGRVSRTYVDNFSNVRAKQAVILLQDISTLEVIVNVPEQDWQRAGPNLTLAQRTERVRPRVRIASVPGRDFPATLTEFSTAADPVTRTFEARLRFDPPDDISLLPGMTAEVAIDIPEDVLGASAAVWIPAAAVLADDAGNATVWNVDAATMRVNRTIVEVGPRAQSLRPRRLYEDHRILSREPRHDAVSRGRCHRRRACLLHLDGAARRPGIHDQGRTHHHAVSRRIRCGG
jgi:RND family efflux transporter MFP subunit